MDKDKNSKKGQEKTNVNAQQNDPDINKPNIVGWFEIPVVDMDRATKFYEQVFKIKLNRQKMGSLDMAWFPMHREGKYASGSLVKNEQYKPSQNGMLNYFVSQSGDLSDELGRVKSAGGKIIREKTKVSDDVGFMALVEDTEGNKIALHSLK